MKYLLLNKNRQAISSNGDVACETLSDEIVPITHLGKVDVKKNTKAQVVDENLIPENILIGKTILGVSGSYEYVDELLPYIEGHITTVNNNATSVRPYAFQSCSNLTTVSLPMCTSVGQGAFYYCSKLTEVSLPMCTYVESAAFQNCSNLTTVSLPACTYVGRNVFYNCKKLESVYLNVSSVPTLDSIDAFTYTPMSDSTYLGYYGSIYVPHSLYEAFCSALNWSNYADRFVSYF